MKGHKVSPVQGSQVSAYGNLELVKMGEAVRRLTFVQKIRHEFHIAIRSRNMQHGFMICCLFHLFLRGALEDIDIEVKLFNDLSNSC
jgi:hypothetical protein